MGGADKSAAGVAQRPGRRSVRRQPGQQKGAAVGRRHEAMDLPVDDALGRWLTSVGPNVLCTESAAGDVAKAGVGSAQEDAEFTQLKRRGGEHAEDPGAHGHARGLAQFHNRAAAKDPARPLALKGVLVEHAVRTAAEAIEPSGLRTYAFRIRMEHAAAIFPGRRARSAGDRELVRHLIAIPACEAIDAPLPQATHSGAAL